MQTEKIEQAIDAAAKKLHALGVEYQAYASANRIRTLRFAQGQVVEYKELEDAGLGVSVAIDKSVGFTSTNDLTEEGIAWAVNRAVRIAKAKEGDEHFRDLAPKKAYENIPVDARLCALSQEEFAAIATLPLNSALAAGKGLHASGATSMQEGIALIRSSSGIEARDHGAFMSSHCTADGKTSDGREFSGNETFASRTLDEKGLEACGASAAEWALRSQSAPAHVDNGKYDIVFGKHGTADLMEHILAQPLSLSAVDVGVSFLQGKKGQEVANSTFSIADDGRHAHGVASRSFDDEGTPTQRTPLIEKGVLHNFISDHYYARKHSLESTGNAMRYAELPGRRFDALPSVSATNMLVEGEELDCIHEIKNGIYAGRIWYTYPINVLQGDFTCSNRSNCFLIENGELTRPIAANSFRIADNMLSMLKRIRGVGREQSQTLVWGGATAVFARDILAEGVHVSYSKGEQLTQGS